MTSKRGKSCSGRPKRQYLATKSGGRLRPDSRKKTGVDRARAGIGAERISAYRRIARSGIVTDVGHKASDAAAG